MNKGQREHRDFWIKESQKKEKMNEQLKEIRVNLARQGRTLTEVAKEIGVSRGMLYYYVNREQAMPGKLINKIKEDFR